MPTTFATPDQCRDIEILADLDEVLAAHERFTPIAAFGLKIDILLASGDTGKPALSKHGGHPDAMIRVRNGEQRAQGLGDVLIHVDAGRYRNKPRRERLATLAHELYHINIRTHKETTLNDDDEEIIVDRPDLDDYGRPVVKLIPDDWITTGFKEVAEWYGPDSCEVKSYRAMGGLLAQALLPFMNGDDRGESGEPDFSRPGPATLGSYDLNGNLLCGRCGSGDLGAVDGGDPLCNACNSTVLRVGTFTAVGKRQKAVAT